MDTKEYLEIIMDQYKQSLIFKKLELEKGEGVCKEVECYLQKKIEEEKVLNNKWVVDEYSSGKKVLPFDEKGIFAYFECSEEGFEIQAIVFCEQEIESYARSYRIFKASPGCDGLVIAGLVTRIVLIKVFEFKPDKL